MAQRSFKLLRTMGALLVLALAASCAHSACLPAKPDIAIYGIELGDPLSTALQLGSGYEVIEEGDDLPYAVFTNATETEVLKLYRNFGDAPGVFNIAEVLGRDDLEEDEEATVLDTTAFRTGRGIRLGMTEKELFALQGTCARSAESVAPIKLFRYELSDITTSDLLKSHNMPLYYAEYAFREDKLVRFAFGFSYP